MTFPAPLLGVSFKDVTSVWQPRSQNFSHQDKTLYDGWSCFRVLNPSPKKTGFQLLPSEPYIQKQVNVFQKVRCALKSMYRGIALGHALAFKGPSQDLLQIKKQTSRFVPENCRTNTLALPRAVPWQSSASQSGCALLAVDQETFSQTPASKQQQQHRQPGLASSA